MSIRCTRVHYLIDLGRYSKWNNDYQKGSAAIEDRERIIDELADQVETDMELLGVTGIEDKLQDGVPEAIAALRHASIYMEQVFV